MERAGINHWKKLLGKKSFFVHFAHPDFYKIFEAVKYSHVISERDESDTGMVIYTDMEIGFYPEAIAENRHVLR